MAIKIGEQSQNIKIMSEKETRRKLMNRAKELNIEYDMKMLLDKFDNLLKKCTNQKERDDIAKLGAYEVYALLDKGGKLYVNNELIYVDKNCSSNQEEDKNKIIIL